MTQVLHKSQLSLSKTWWLMGDRRKLFCTLLEVLESYRASPPSLSNGRHSSHSVAIAWKWFDRKQGTCHIASFDLTTQGNMGPTLIDNTWHNILSYTTKIRACQYKKSPDFFLGFLVVTFKLFGVSLLNAAAKWAIMWWNCIIVYTLGQM